MKGPLCEECIKSGVLCEECSKKLENKEISELDIEVARLLYKLEKRDLVRGASFERAHLIGNLIVISTKGRVGTLVGKGGRVVRLLSHELNKKVRVVSVSNMKSMLADLISPAKIQGINIVYKPSGEQTKVIISHEDKYKLIAPRETLEKAANLLSDRTIVLEVK